jgi:protease-4
MRTIFSATLLAWLSLSGTCESFAQEDRAAAQKPAPAGPRTIPVFDLAGPVTEKPVGDDFPFSFGGSTGESLKSLTDRLEKVSEDDKVPAIVILPGNLSIGRAQAQELRRALDQVRASGRQIHVHADTLTTGQLVLLSGASDLSMVPTGYMFITGVYGEQLFLRGLLDSIGVVPDYFTCGDYKSAGETFMRRKPSDESAEMSKWLFDGIYGEMIRSIAAGRGVEPSVAESWIDQGVFTAETAGDAGIIDAIEHRQDFEARLRQLYGDDLKFDRRYGRKKSAEIDLSSPFGILNFYAELLSPPTSRRSTKPGVGIVYLEGSIMPGDSGGNPLLAGAGAFSNPIRKALDEAAEDDAIKAVVLRVNSPGGSAVASEIILDATRRVASKKPFVVSMGDVAASGGYYVACGSDTIFVDESTITGSIGVVVGKFSTTGMWEKLGITWSPIQRGRNAALLSSADVFSKSEREAMEGYMNEVYDIFKRHVVAARGDRLKKDIDELAGGRVYTGQQAIELGLADSIGGLSDAVEFAAAQAELKEGYDVRIIPRPKNFMELLMSDLTGSKDDSGHLSLPAQFADSQSLVDSVLPLLRSVDPDRANALKQALCQMMILQRERVSLTMPVLNLAP